MHFATLPLVSTLFLAAVAPTQELLAFDFQGQAFGVDVLTGQSRTIGSTGASFCNAMASHAGVLYATASASSTTPSRLVTIDPITAQATVLFPNLGVDVRALCSNEGTQQLFAIANGSPDSLVRIDVTTGVTTTIGSTGMTGIQALDTAGGFGPLSGWDVNLGLVRIDRTTGLATDVDPNLGAQGAIIQFLALYRDNNSIHLLGGNTSLYEIDRFTGVVTQIGTSTNLPDLRGAEHRRGKASEFGAGCLTAATSASTLNAKAELLAGSVVPLLSKQHAPNSLGILIVGLSNTVSAGTPLPIGLDPIFGTSGCQLFVSADLLLAAQANGAGTFSVPFTMPPQFGLAVFFQLAALEAVPGGLSFSSGFGVQTPF